MTEAMSFQHVPHVVAQAAIVLVRQSHQGHFEDLGRADGRQQVRALFVELHTGVPRVLFVHEEKPADTAAVWFRAGGALSDGGVTAFHGGRAGKGLHGSGCGLSRFDVREELLHGVDPWVFSDAALDLQEGRERDGRGIRKRLNLRRVHGRQTLPDFGCGRDFGFHSCYCTASGTL